MPWALKAQQLLADEWNVDADVWSATSWNELRRDAIECEEHNLLYPQENVRVPHRDIDPGRGARAGRGRVGLDARGSGPDLALGARRLHLIGTDGFGFADTRGAARRFFHVDAESIVVATLAELSRRGEVKPEAAREGIDRYQLLDVRAAGTGTVGGDS